MPAKKDTTRVNLALPNELLEQSDLLAELMGLDRYDVVRVALAQGLAVVRMQYEFAVNADTYKTALRDFATGQEGSEERLSRVVTEGVELGVKEQLKKRAEKKK